MMLFIKFLLAHLLGDFVLQPDSWVRKKEAQGYYSIEFYLHGLVHFILIMLLTWDAQMIPAALTIAVSHLFIDAIKLGYQTEKSKRTWFFADQLLHLIVLVIIVLILDTPSWDTLSYITEPAIIIFTGIIFLLKPSSLLVKNILAKWAPATEIKSDRIETPSLLHAGEMIGYLERILIFIFILLNQWSAIGFLITAKSVFRFSDLKLGQDRKLTEYILIGTLLSFSTAIVTGLIVRWVLRFMQL